MGGAFKYRLYGHQPCALLPPTLSFIIVRVVVSHSPSVRVRLLYYCPFSDFRNSKPNVKPATASSHCVCLIYRHAAVAVVVVHGQCDVYSNEQMNNFMGIVLCVCVCVGCDASVAAGGGHPNSHLGNHKRSASRIGWSKLRNLSGGMIWIAERAI